MKNTNVKTILSVVLALTLCLFTFAGCGQAAPAEGGNELASGGILVLRVNPEIAVSYDENGNVTGVTARNDDAREIIAEYNGYEGKACKTVVSELVAEIGEAGYFVEEIEGEKRQVIIEIESGSKLPNRNFLDEVTKEIRDCVSKNNWNHHVEVKGESDYGKTDYVDTDYGPNPDGVTDYNDTDYGEAETDYDDTNYGEAATDYDDTNYGEAATDYDDTNYGEAATDYDDTDYGEAATDYDDTNYGEAATDYDDTNYGEAESDYDDTNYGEAESDYDDSDYGEAESDYNNSDYDGDSDYDH